MLCYHMGGQLDGHILLLWQPAIVFLLLCYTVCYVCLANKLSLSLLIFLLTDVIVSVRAVATDCIVFV